MYRVEYTSQALKQLKEMGRFDALLILSWIGKRLEGTDDPRRHGTALSGDRADQWRYRVGSYRILCLIQDDRLIIEVFPVVHRREVYDKR